MGAIGPQLQDALRSAAWRQVFVEDRIQAGISASPSGPVEQSALRVVGVALDGERSLHLSDPPLSRLTGEAGDEPLSGLLAVPSLPLGRWRELVRGLARDGVEARITAFHQNVWVEGREGSHQDSRRTARIELQSVADPGVALDYILKEDPPSDLGDRVRERAKERRGAVAIDPSRDGPPLVLAAGLGGVVVHELVGHALEGDATPVGCRLASASGPIASSHLRVVDDPRLCRASWAVDDEGVAPAAVTLLERGRVVGRLLDRASARAAGTASTGHGRRGSYLDPVLPRMGCTFIEPGPSHPLEIVREVIRGVFVRRLVAAHADPVAGRATFIVTDSDRIEDGRITCPLRPFLVELDVLDALSSMDRIGDDLVFDTCVGSCVRAGQPLAVSVGAPTVRIGLVRAII